MEPLAGVPPNDLTVRRAQASDLNSLALLDEQHARHYVEAPVFMAAYRPTSVDGWREFLARPANTAWLAEAAGGPVGFMCFTRDYGASALIESDQGIFLSGAFVVPSRRGEGIATCMLDAALQHYAQRGVTSCALDFEAFNPEASAFWPRYFTPVCLTLMRVPEHVEGADSAGAR
jgi:GNAT superfamily N-acetyltransferase